MRAFLTNFLTPDDKPADINALGVGLNASGREIFDEALGIESSDMTADEIERHRPAAYRQMAAAASADKLFFKIHDAYKYTSRGESTIPADVTWGAIYLVRNPLDVAVSAAHHFSQTLDEAIRSMADDTRALAADPSRLRPYLTQRYLSWSRHVLSWLDQREIAIHLMRYEDMCRHPLETFTTAIEFLGMTGGVDRVRRAITFSSFQSLREQEQIHGFRGRPSGAGSFFRNGRPGGWREVLSDVQAGRIIHDHRHMMQRLGYLSEIGGRSLQGTPAGR